MARKNTASRKEDQPQHADLLTEGSPDYSPWEEEEETTDFSELDLEKISKTVVYGTDWTTETLKNQIRSGNIVLNPKFQRRDAWDISRKSRLIESLILGIPVPNIVLAEEKKARGKFIVLDGKQRLLSILQFFGESQFNGDEHNGFPLKKLEFLKDLEGKSYQGLKDNHEDFARAYENQSIRAIFLRDWPHEEFLFTVFSRLNQGSVRLNFQELRLSLYPGEFIDQIDYHSSRMPVMKNFFPKHPDPRMGDAELLLRTLAFQKRLPEYRGKLRAFLDETCKQFSEHWSQEKEGFNLIIQEIEEAVECGLEILGTDTFARRLDVRKSKKFNRALFDILVYYFTDPLIREAAKKESTAVAAAYKELFQDQGFINTVQQSTKGSDATFLRFQKWGKVLSNTLGLAIDLPKQRTSIGV